MKKILVCLMAMILVFTSVSFAEQSQIQDTLLAVGSITTGMPTDKPDQIMVAQFDNEPGARPQMGIGSADIVYETVLYNGGYTRYTAVFNDTIPEKIEAVRSARMVNVDMYLEYGGAFIHYGGQQHEGSSVYDYFDRVNMQARFDGLTDGKNFYRDNQRSAPNNVVGCLGQMYENTDWTNITCKSPLKFSEFGYTVKGVPAASFGVKYRSGYEPAYKYSDGLYYRFYNGSEHKDGLTGEQLTCSNVIIQYVDYAWYDGASDRPIVTTTGTNKCEYFIDGMHFTGYWERASVNDSTVYYDDEGNQVAFKPGKTFIQFVSGSEEITIAE